MINIKQDEIQEIRKLLQSINRLDLMSQSMLCRSFTEIKKILVMPEWDDPKFQRLLTSNIWISNYENIKKILAMPEWDDPKFQGLLTSTIWKNNYEDIKKKLYLPYWNENKYLQLLVPSIFSITIKNIEDGIAVLREYGIDKYVTNKCLRFRTDFLRNLLKYLVENGIDLITFNQVTQQYGLSQILSCEKGQLMKKYGIDIKTIEKGTFTK